MTHQNVSQLSVKVMLLTLIVLWRLVKMDDYGDEVLEFVAVLWCAEGCFGLHEFSGAWSRWVTGWVVV